MVSAALTGFLSGFSLILAIGAQNSFVLRQGLAGAHVFWLCLLCSLSDAVLIVAGVVGFGALVSIAPIFPTVMALAGAAFLAAYGALRLRAAYSGHYHSELSGRTGGLWATLATGAAMTWLNPHVYLDTLGLIGAISTQYETTSLRTAFAVGATIASFTFFFSLGYGARLLAPVMASTKAWRVLDVGIALVMWALALGLIRSVL